MDIKIIHVFKHDNVEEVEGLVPAKCALGYYHVKIKIQGFRLLDSECECGNKFCPHAIKLELAYIKKKSSG